MRNIETQIAVKEFINERTRHSKEILVNRHAAYQTWLYKARLRLLKGNPPLSNCDSITRKHDNPFSLSL